MKVDRLVSIIMVLLEKERVGAQELADLFEVSLRTICRDIDAINMTGIPVRSTSGMGGGFEIILETMQTKIKIRIHKSVMDRVLDLCAYENFTPDGEEYYIVDFPYIENDYYYDVLLSFGDKCECLEPPRVRGEMKRKIQRLAALYA